MDYVTRYNHARCDGGELGRWRLHAYEVIVGVMKRRHFSTRETLACIDAAYPFGVRKHYPYAAWLKERRHAMVAMGLREPTARVAKLLENAEQLAMWED